jgi:hypothetical protein
MNNHWYWEADHRKTAGIDARLDALARDLSGPLKLSVASDGGMLLTLSRISPLIDAWDLSASLFIRVADLDPAAVCDSLRYDGAFSVQVTVDKARVLLPKFRKLFKPSSRLLWIVLHVGAPGDLRHIWAPGREG